MTVMLDMRRAQARRRNPIVPGKEKAEVRVEATWRKDAG